MILYQLDILVGWGHGPSGPGHFFNSYVTNYQRVIPSNTFGHLVEAWFHQALGG